MCKFGIHQNRSHLSSGDIELEEGHLALITLKGAYIGLLVGAGIGK
jgi:hypothetical protein